MSQLTHAQSSHSPTSLPFIPFPPTLEGMLTPVRLKPYYSGECPNVVVSLYENERPLQGFAGWVDWSLNQELTRWIHKGWLTGQAGEMGLVPYELHDKKLTVLTVGMGTTSSPGKRLSLPTPLKESLTQSLIKLKWNTVGLDLADLGLSSTTELEKKLRGVKVWNL